MLAMPEAGEPLNEEELQALDAQYEPLQPFLDWWPQDPPREDLWDEVVAALDDQAESVNPDQLNAAQEISLRAAAFDSGAIEGLYNTDEGLTITVATQAALWEQTLERREPEAREHFEAQRRALDLVLDVATGSMPKVTEAWIRQLHEEVTAAQETYTAQTPIGPRELPLPRGEYKREPNHVLQPGGGIHPYAPVDQTGPEMHQFVEQLNSAAFKDAHPVLQASYAHYGIVAIHPFADGNGRVARTLSSLYLYRAARVPLLVFADQKNDYRDTLARADTGDPWPFVRFVADSARSAIQMVTEQLLAAAGPKPEALMQAFEDLLHAQGDLTYKQIDQVGDATTNALIDLMDQEIRQLPRPEGVGIELMPVHGDKPATPRQGMRPMVDPGHRGIQIGFSADEPVQAAAHVRFDVFVSTGGDTAETVHVVDRSGPALTFGLREVHPKMTIAAQQRFRAYFRRRLGAGLEDLYARATKTLRRQGYG
jgi:Fic family protein